MCSVVIASTVVITITVYWDLLAGVCIYGFAKHMHLQGKIFRFLTSGGGMCRFPSVFAGLFELETSFILFSFILIAVCGHPFVLLAYLLSFLPCMLISFAIPVGQLVFPTPPSVPLIVSLRDSMICQKENDE